MVSNSSIAQAQANLNAQVASGVSESQGLQRALRIEKGTEAKANSGQEVKSVEAATSNESTSNKATKVAGGLKKVFSRMNINLKVEVDSRTKQMVVKVIDPDTNEVIKKFPEDSLADVGKKVQSLLDFESYSGEAIEGLTLLEDSMVTS